MKRFLTRAGIAVVLLFAVAFAVAAPLVGTSIGWGIGEFFNPSHPEQESPGVVIPPMFVNETTDPSSDNDRALIMRFKDGTEITLTLCPIELGPC